MRNWIAELKDAGVSFAKIARETGLTASRVSSIARGADRLKSTTRTYEIVRNLSRRTAYQHIRESGGTPEFAHQYERTAFSPRTYYHSIERLVKQGRKIERLQGEMQQLKIVGEFRNVRTGETRYKDGVSFARKKIHQSDIDAISINAYEDELENVEAVEDYSESSQMLNEAINSARGKLGGSNWELVRIIDIELITFHLV